MNFNTTLHNSLKWVWWSTWLSTYANRLNRIFKIIYWVSGNTDNSLISQIRFNQILIVKCHLYYNTYGPGHRIKGKTWRKYSFQLLFTNNLGVFPSNFLNSIAINYKSWCIIILIWKSRAHWHENFELLLEVDECYMLVCRTTHSICSEC